jgi:hypothetical protein
MGMRQTLMPCRLCSVIVAVTLFVSCRPTHPNCDLDMGDVELWKELIEKEVLGNNTKYVGYKVHHDMYSFRLGNVSNPSELTMRIVDRACRENGFRVISKHNCEGERYPIFFHLLGSRGAYYISSGLADDANHYIFVVRKK